ncbi:MAG: HEPN domain-containing protein [Bacteroidales bacterium]
MSATVQYWIDISDYDFDTAQAMLKTGRYLYVGFMCHQVVEKILKAYFVHNKGDIPPYTHSLSYLCRITSLESLLSTEQTGFLDELEPLNIQGRYPTYKELIMKGLTPSTCKKIIQETNTFRQWVKAKL